MRPKKKKKLTEPQRFVLVAVLVFAAISLLLHLVSLQLDSVVLLPEPETAADTAPSETVTPELPESAPEEPEPVYEDPAPFFGEAAAPEPEPEPEITVLSVATDEAHRLTVYADDLPSFDFSTAAINDDGTELYLVSADGSSILRLSAGVEYTSLDAVRESKIAEYKEFGIPYSVSQRATGGARAQVIDHLDLLDLHTDILVATPAGLLEFSVNRAEDSGGIVYSEVASYLQRQYDLTVPVAPEIAVPEDYAPAIY